MEFLKVIIIENIFEVVGVTRKIEWFKILGVEKDVLENFERNDITNDFASKKS